MRLLCGQLLAHRLLATNLNNLSWITRSHMVEGRRLLLGAVLWFSHMFCGSDGHCVNNKRKGTKGYQGRSETYKDIVLLQHTAGWRIRVNSKDGIRGEAWSRPLLQQCVTFNAHVTHVCFGRPSGFCTPVSKSLKKFSYATSQLHFKFWLTLDIQVFWQLTLWPYCQHQRNWDPCQS